MALHMAKFGIYFQMAWVVMYIGGVGPVLLLTLDTEIKWTKVYIY